MHWFCVCLSEVLREGNLKLLELLLKQCGKCKGLRVLLIYPSKLLGINFSWWTVRQTSFWINPTKINLCLLCNKKKKISRRDNSHLRLSSNRCYCNGSGRFHLKVIYSASYSDTKEKTMPTKLKMESTVYNFGKVN